ncbi:MAG: family 10 glycosylhydrolase [Candidatus Coatesbacteria bacterium]|nr:MAG: family 10 glycosylhydrolase [Candidatus Coatesbacteria bacterium]
MLRTVVITSLLSATAAGAVAAEEARGVWVCPWELNAPEDVPAVVELAKEANLNAIFYEVRYRGDALYVPNRYTDKYPNPEPRSPHLAGTDPEFDPLAELISEAHAAGIRVHAWVTTFVTLNEKTPTPDGHPAVDHPDWLARTKSGDKFDVYNMAWLDPGLPEVQDYLYNVLMDIVVNYDIDGLHLDYVRYSDGGALYNDEALKRYKRETGLPISDTAALDDWRRAQITRFVARLGNGVKREKPAVELSAAVFAVRKSKAYGECRQDWTTWLEEGIVDFVVPMAYSRDAGTVAEWVADGVSVKGDRFLYAGVWSLVDGGGEPTSETYSAIADRITASREVGADGIVLYSFTGLEQRDGYLARRLGEGPFKGKALYPAMPWKRLPRPGRYPIEVVALNLSGAEKYGVEMRAGTPRKYAFLLAKEISAWTDEPVYLVPAKGDRYRVIAGKFDKSAGAEALKKTLTNKGY